MAAQNNDPVEWALESGVWVEEPGGKPFSLRRTAAGSAVSPLLTLADATHVAGIGVARRGERLYPPDFRFDPDDGAPLVALPPAAEAGIDWVAPFGGLPLGDAGAKAGVPRGLQQTTQTIGIALRRREARPTDDAPRSLPMPPRGDHQLFALRARTRRPVLVALDPARGQLSLYLPASRQWVALTEASGRPLAGFDGAQVEWGCEVLSGDDQDTLLVPTAASMAVVRVDALSASFSVDHLASGAAIGAPIAVGDQVWLPARDDGDAWLVGVDRSGAPLASVALPPDCRGEFTRVVSDSRAAIWIGAAGQLVVRDGGDEPPQARWIAWPAHLRPAFEFGCPYAAAAGGFWQLCFDTAADSYAYVRLGTELVETIPVHLPRFCSGTLNFQGKARLKREPWVDLDHDDSRASDPSALIPLVESTDGAAAIGVNVANEASLSSLLASDDRVPARLIFCDDHSFIEFHTIVVSRPWRSRVFEYEGGLWLYHPQLEAIAGWPLGART